MNVQLADHDTPTSEALRLTDRLFEEAERLGGLEISIEIHRDTCTETPEKTYALADAYFADTGRLLPITWDFSLRDRKASAARRLFEATARARRTRDTGLSTSLPAI